MKEVGNEAMKIKNRIQKMGLYILPEHAFVPGHEGGTPRTGHPWRKGQR